MTLSFLLSLLALKPVFTCVRGINQVTFAGETGFGSGVTAGFYSRVAQEFQTRAVGRSLLRVGASPPPPPLALDDDSAASTVRAAEGANSRTSHSGNNNDDASASSGLDESYQIITDKTPRESLVSLDASGCGTFNGLFGEASSAKSSPSSSSGGASRGPGANRLRAVLSVHRVSVPRPTPVLTANGYATEALLLRTEKHDTVPLQPLSAPSAFESGNGGDLSMEFALAGPEEDEDDDDEEGGSVEMSSAIQNSQVDDVADGQPLTVAVSPSAWMHVRGRDVLRRPTMPASSQPTAAADAGAQLVLATNTPEEPHAATIAAVGESDGHEASNDKDEKTHDDGGTEYPLAAVLLPEPFPGTFAVMRRPPRRLPPLSPSKDNRISSQSSSTSGHQQHETVEEMPCATVLYREPAVTNAPVATDSGSPNSSQSSSSVSAPSASAAPLPCPGSVALLAAMGGRNGGVASGGRGLELWTTENSAHDRSTRSAKVSVVPGSAALPRWVRSDDDVDDYKSGSDDTNGNSGSSSSNSSSSARWEIEFEVEGPLPSAWAPPGEPNTSAPPSPARPRTSNNAENDNSSDNTVVGSGSSGPIVGKVHVGLAVQGAPWSAPLFVPDRDPSPHGSAEVPRGLFPAPLPPGADGDLVLRRFTFLGRLFGKVLGLNLLD